MVEMGILGGNAPARLPKKRLLGAGGWQCTGRGGGKRLPELEWVAMLRHRQFS